MSDDTKQTPDERLAAQHPMLNLLAGIEHQLTRIADSMNTPPTRVTADQVAEAWDAELRMYGEKAIPILNRLGIEVDG